MPFVGSLRMQTTGDSSAKIQTTDPSLEDVRGQVGWKWSHRKGSWWTIFWEGEFIPKIGRWGSEMEVRQEYVASFRVSPDSHYSADISKMLRLQEPFQPPKDETLWHGDLAKATPSKLFMMLVDYSKAHGTLKKLKAKVKRHNPTNIFGAQTNSQAVSIRYIYIYTLSFQFHSRCPVRMPRANLLQIPMMVSCTLSPRWHNTVWRTVKWRKPRLDGLEGDESSEAGFQFCNKDSRADLVIVINYKMPQDVLRSYKPRFNSPSSIVFVPVDATQAWNAAVECAMCELP